MKSSNIKNRFTKKWKDVENLSMKMEIELNIPSKEEESFMNQEQLL
jgi:hypothetical protein